MRCQRTGARQSLVTVLPWRRRNLGPDPTCARSRRCPPPGGAPPQQGHSSVSLKHRFHSVTIALIAVVIAAVGSLSAGAQERVIAKVNGKTITDTDMKLAEVEIGSDLGSLPEATKRRVLIEFLIETQLFADAAEGQKLVVGNGFEEPMQYWRRRALRDAYFDKSVRRASPTRRPGNFTKTRWARRNRIRRCVLATSWSRARTRRARSTKNSPTAATSRGWPKSTPRTQDRRTRAGTLASSDAVKWFRSSRRPCSA